jgi:hypothetical protein
MSDLELSSLLAAEAQARPTDAERERGRERLLGAIAAGATPMAISTAPLAAGLGASTTAKLLVGVGVVGLVGATVAGSAIVQREHETRVPQTLAPHVSATSSEPRHVPVSSATPRLSAIAPTPEAPRSVASAGSSFEDELRLIEAAKRELDSAHASLALAALAEHARRFPRGVFRSEREGLRVLVACPNETPAARLSAAAAFQRAYPDSPLLDRIWRTCGDGNDAGSLGAQEKTK